MKTGIKRALTMCALAAASLGASSAAQAQTTHHGVTFTPSFAGNVLTIEIDAASPSGSWNSATMIGALAVEQVGTWTTFDISGPGNAALWLEFPNELSANGCDGGFLGAQRACGEGLGEALTDDMIFTFTFTGGVQDLSFPHIKLNMLNAEGEQVGAVSIGRVPAIPEPSTYAMLLGGLGILALARRRTKKTA